MRHHIGLIGCGGIAGAWIQAVALHEHCDIALTYDLDPDAARQRAAESGAQAVADLNEILGADEIDMVVVGTPTPNHPDLVVSAVQAGKHVMCEKPMALSLDDCRRMIEAAEGSRVKLAIGHSLRFWGAFRACRRLVSAGAIGAPVSGSVDRMGVATARCADDSTDGKVGDHWRDDVRRTGGNVLEGFIHELDFARAIFGEVASVSCHLAGGDAHDGWSGPNIVMALISFMSGGLVTARSGGVVALPCRGCWIGGTEGGLRFDDWGGPIEHWRYDAEMVSVRCENLSAYYLELCDLVEAVEYGTELENSGDNGMKNVALGLGMYRSWQTRRRIDYEDGLPVNWPAYYRNTSLP